MVFREMDVKNTFLHEELSDEVYMLPPLEIKVKVGKVCILTKSL